MLAGAQYVQNRPDDNSGPVYASLFPLSASQWMTIYKHIVYTKGNLV